MTPTRTHPIDGNALPRPSPDVNIQATAQAALSLCESLILALSENHVLDKDEIKGVLDDAMRTHQNAADRGDEHQDVHLTAAALVQRMKQCLDAVAHQ